MADSKVAVVIGVGPGLGASVALRFARGGYAIGLVARGDDKLAPVQKQVESRGGRALSVAADATDPAALEAALQEIRGALGAPEVLIYNAGAFKRGGVLELTPQDFDECWKANCAGAFYAARLVVPEMLSRHRGTLLLTGATASLRGSAGFAALAVGKFGLRALSQSLARELGPRGIHVAHVVIDGQIDTPRIRELMPDRDAATLLSPDAIAEAYWQLHSQDPTAWTLELDLRPAVEKF